MIEKQWEPLTTAEAVIEAIKAGRHVEMMPRGNRKGWLSINPKAGAEQFTAWIDDGDEFRALIAPAQPAADELRGGAAEPVGAVSSAAQKIAERVPLPLMEIIERIPITCDRAMTGYTADQLRAYGLAVDAEALRGAEAVVDRGGPDFFMAAKEIDEMIEQRGKCAPSVGQMREWSRLLWLADKASAPPAGSVEVTDTAAGLRELAAWASVLRCERSEFAHGYAAARRHVQEIIRQHPALTAALQEP